MRKLYRITRQRFIRDLSGGGSAKYGGRWNPKGCFVLYTAGNPSLALLEWLAQVRDREMDDVYYMATILVPDLHFRRIDYSELPENWRNNPGPISLKQFGSGLVSDEKYLGLEVPSVLMPLDYNIVLNVQHPYFSKAEIASIESLDPGSRLV